MQDKGRTHASYKSLYRVKPVLFYAGDIKLPFPINLEVTFIFGCIMAVYYLICVKVLGSLLISLGLVPWMLALGLAFLSTWLTTQFDAAGKFIPRYLFDAVAYLARRKTYTLCGKVIIKKRKQKCKWNLEVGS